MLRQKQYSVQHTSTVLFVKEGEGDAAAQAAAAASAKAATDAAIAAAVAKGIEEATTGLKNKNSELLGKMKELQEKSKLFDGLDPVALKEMKDRLDADEDAKLLATGKKNEVIEKYTQRMRAEHDAQLEAERLRTKAETDRANNYRGSVLDNAIRSVLTGLHPGAIEDAILQGRQIFSLDAKGNAVKLDAQGVPELGKDGSTPFSPAEWIALQKETKPHWFPMSSSGSGSNAARDASGTGKIIKRADFDRMAPAEQVTTVKGGTKIVD